MRKKITTLLVLAAAAIGAAACGQTNPPANSGDVELTGTALAVAKASAMTYDELVAAAKAEMEASTDTFKVLGLTSALKTAVTQLTSKYEWLKDKTYVNNGYKDYTLLTALEPATDTYVADYALTQDERSIADYTRTGILHNFVPSDYASVGLSKKDTEPLKGIHFNKIFWTNTNFETVNHGLKLHNIWQMAGKASDEGHISNVSFQSPATEQINMSFLLSVMDPANQADIEAAYQKFYGTAWNNGSKYANAGSQWVEEFIANISRFHSSDGTAMKQTQLESDWRAGYVYFGAYSKMKDAAGLWYAVEGQDTDPLLKDIIDVDAKFTVEEKDASGNKVKVEKTVTGVNAMKTVKWDWEIDGFNGYFYTMDSQIVNNAKHPYTACLFARYMLDGGFYTSAIYSSKTPNVDGGNGNQYGYYYPGEMGEYSKDATKPVTNGIDWTKTKWQDCSICEDYSYLSKVKATKVAYINSLVADRQAALAKK